MLQVLKDKVKNIVIYFKLINLQFKWRRNNAHNETKINNLCNIEKVTVGNFTYGALNIMQWKSDNEKLEIGSYVSIAPGVKFLLGGNHRYDVFSTYPIRQKVCGEAVIESYSNGAIVIEDEVWIGMDSMIMSGVKVARGAVIAAGSIVCNDVPAYSIVGGNPAKIIKYRFEKEIIDEMMKININKIDKEYFINNTNLFYKKVNKEIIKEINSYSPNR